MFNFKSVVDPKGQGFDGVEKVRWSRWVEVTVFALDEVIFSG